MATSSQINHTTTPRAYRRYGLPIITKAVMDSAIMSTASNVQSNKLDCTIKKMMLTVQNALLNSKKDGIGGNGKYKNAKNTKLFSKILTKLRSYKNILAN